MMQGSRATVRRVGVGLVLAMAFAVSGAVGTAVAAVNQAAPTQVAQAIGGSGGSGSASSDPVQYGLGDSPLAGFPTGASPFGVISSGDVTFADDPNDSAGTSGGPASQDPARGEAFDPATLTVDFTVPEGQNCLNVDYKFLSEEFPEFVNSGFNDAFVAELDATNWLIQTSPETGQLAISAPGDFAAGYGDRVSVDTVGPTIVTEADAAGTTYDAATAVLTAKTPIAAGPHTIYLSVFDSGDAIYDSAVFLDNLRFTNEPPKQCAPPDLFAGATGITPLDKKVNFDGSTALVDLTCTLPVGAVEPCVGKATLSASFPSGASAKRAKAKKIAKGTYSIAPASSGQAQLKLNAKGKKLFKKTKRAKGKLKITNTVNGVSSTSKIKVKK